MSESDESVYRVLPVIIFIQSPALENTLCCSTSRRETDHYPQSLVDADHLKLNLFLHAIRVDTVLNLRESVCCYGVMPYDVSTNNLTLALQC